LIFAARNRFDRFVKQRLDLKLFEDIGSVCLARLESHSGSTNRPASRG